MEEQTASVDVPLTAIAALDELVGKLHSDRGNVIALLLHAYSVGDSGLVDALIEGESDFASGRTFSHEEVVAEFRARFAGVRAA